MMRALYIGLMLAMTSSGAMVYSEEASVTTESQVTVQDLDRQIKFLHENIEKYNGLARNFDKKAGSLQSRDYTGARDVALLRDECRGIAKDLEAHLAKLEVQRAQMIEQQNAKK